MTYTAAPFASAALALLLTGFAPAAPSPETTSANQAVAQRLPLGDQGDFEDARRGKLAEIPGGIIRGAEGGVVWDANELSFLQGDAPASANPSLWRQSKLLAEHGLYEVADGLYQVRGYDLANMTVIRGDEGWIVIDPLTTVEAARASLKLVDDTLGERPVSAVIFTHSHGDHFGGVAGLDMAEGTPVYAPHGFMEEAVSENLLAGPIMTRRVQFMFGSALPGGVREKVGMGLGPGLSTGQLSLAPVTREIGPEPETVEIDGITFEFMDAEGTEAPAEFIFFIPEFDALHMAEVATGTFHNALTPRGAKARDTLRWSKVIDRALIEFGDQADVVLASHHWPTWGRERVASYLENQRDIYRYVHDQTLRRANRGETMHEIAEGLPEPAFASEDFAVRDYYGTLKHNAKAVYQYYFGWWDGVPATFMPHTPEDESARYVEALGGPERTLALGRQAHAEGDYAWAARLLNHLVFAGKGGQEAKDALAASYRQLGYQIESGAVRNYYLVAAMELEDGTPDLPARAQSSAFLAGTPTDALFDALAVRYAPERVERYGTIQFRFPDRGEILALELRPSVLIPRLGVEAEAPTAALTIDRADYDRLVAQEVAPPELMQSGAMQVEGDASFLMALFGALETPPRQPAIVTP